MYLCKVSPIAYVGKKKKGEEAQREKRRKRSRVGKGWSSDNEVVR